MTKEMKLGVLTLGAAVAVTTGCGGNKATTSPSVQAPQGPAWISKNPGAEAGAAGGVFYAVGMSSIKHPSLRRTNAIDMGRGELAKIMNSYATVLSKSYLAATVAGDPSKQSIEEHATNTQKVFAKFTLIGSYAAENWVAADGTEYALVKMDLNKIKEALDQAKELDSKLRDYIRANAEKHFDELRAEESRSAQ